MAYMARFWCTKCHQIVQEAVGSGEIRNVCRSCENKEKQEKRAIYLKGLEALTIEERIAKIEAWIYDYKPPIHFHDVRF